MRCILGFVGVERDYSFLGGINKSLVVVNFVIVFSFEVLVFVK